MRLALLASLMSGALLVIAACSSEELFSGGGTGASAGTGAATTTTTGSGGTTTTTTTSGTAAGGSGAGGATTTTTTSGTAGAGGTGPGPNEIPCSQQICSSPNICCISYNGAQYDLCAPPGSCGDNTLEAACNGPSDCPELEVCCGRYVQDGQNYYYSGISCSLTCVPDVGSIGVVMCDGQQDCLVGTCVPSQWLPDGFNYCAT